MPTKLSRPSRMLTSVLWSYGQAEPAARFNDSLFSGGPITRLARYPTGVPDPAGLVMTLLFCLLGQDAARAPRVFAAILRMGKLDTSRLRAAARAG